MWCVGVCALFVLYFAGGCCHGNDGPHQCGSSVQCLHGEADDARVSVCASGVTPLLPQEEPGHSGCPLHAQLLQADR